MGEVERYVKSLVASYRTELVDDLPRDMMPAADCTLRWCSPPERSWETQCMAY